MRAIEKARQIALEAHGDQRYGNQPYWVHLEAVAGILVRFGYGEREDLMVSAYLHDTLEDTNLPEDAVRSFGESVLIIVKAVTNEAGANRKERNAKTYPKIKANIDALTLKLADRIANVEASVANSPEKLGMYQKEYPDFREALFDERLSKMWSHLDSLLK